MNTRTWIAVSPPKPVRMWRRVAPLTTPCASAHCRAHRDGFTHLNLDAV